ncbi:MAG: NAD-dependent epimerase/dehydratase family protein, partial [Alphaproteobacteria bacterium]
MDGGGDRGRLPRLDSEAVHMKMLILGGSGQVGWELQRWLAPLGEVVVTTRPELDLCDPDGIGRVLGGHRPDAVINAAAYT